MRRLNEIIFDDFVVSTTSAYTSAQHNDQLGRYDKFAVQVVADQPSGAVPVSIVLEHSADGRNWVQKGSSVAISFTTSTSATSVAFGSDADASPSLGFVRLRIDLTGATPSTHLKILLTARDDAASRQSKRRDDAVAIKATPCASGGTCDDDCCGEELAKGAAPVRKGAASSLRNAIPGGMKHLLQAFGRRGPTTATAAGLAQRAMHLLTTAGKGNSRLIPDMINELRRPSSLASSADGLSTNAGGKLQLSSISSAPHTTGPGFLCVRDDDGKYGCDWEQPDADPDNVGGDATVIGFLIAIVIVAILGDFNDKDELAETKLDGASCAQINQMNDSVLIPLFHDMISGPTLDAEENSMLKALECLPCTRVVSLISSLGSVDDFISEFQGDELDRLILRLKECGLVGFDSSHFDDDASRLFVANHSCAEIKQMSLGDVHQLILNMFDGDTGDDDENAINKLVGCLSPCKLMDLLKMQGTSLADFDSQIQGSEWTDFSNIYWHAFFHCPAGVEFPG